MRQNKKLLIAAIASLLAITNQSCSKHDHDEEELITTVKLSFQNTSTGTTSTFTFADPDGDGGNGPTTFDTIKLSANTSYKMSVALLNESVSPSVNLTDEIVTEANDHQLYYEASTNLNIGVTNLNKDNNNLPLGITADAATLAASNGRLQVILKHKPGIKAAGDTKAVGDTDIELPNGGFYTVIQ
jgi:hypothetical protein